MTLHGRVVIITGAGSGIGRATALACAEQGAYVVACGRNMSSLNETVAQITLSGGTGLALSLDVTEPAGVRGMTETVLQQLGKIDVLVNNAGVIAAKHFLEVTGDEWSEQIDTNLTGIFNCCQSVLPAMIDRGSGIIINVSSILGKTGVARLAAYCSSKFGVLGITQSLADEFGQRGIKVFAVCPGGTDTQLHRGVVGEEAAQMAMSPVRVAGVILGLMTFKIVIPSGGNIVVDDQAESTTVTKRMMHSLIRLFSNSIGRFR